MTTPRNSGHIKVSGPAGAIQSPDPPVRFTSFFGKEESCRQETNKRYPAELRERAVRMVTEVEHEYPSEWTAIEPITDKLAIGTARTLLNWIQRAQTDAGERPGVTSEMAAEMRKLRAENRELKRVNEILKSAS